MLNPDQTALIVATPGLQASSRPTTRTGRRAWASPTASTTRPCSAAAAGIYYNPNQTNSYTFLNTNPPCSPIFQCNWSAGLPPLSLSNPLRVPAACPLPGSNSGALIVTPPWTPAHAAHEPVERQPAAPVVERRRSRSCSISARIPTTWTAASTTTRRCPGPGRRELAPAESSCSARSAPSTTT